MPLDVQEDIRRMDRDGATRADIARKLHPSRNTVRKHADMEICRRSRRSRRRGRIPRQARWPEAPGGGLPAPGRTLLHGAAMREGRGLLLGAALHIRAGGALSARARARQRRRGGQAFQEGLAGMPGLPGVPSGAARWGRAKPGRPNHFKGLGKVGLPRYQTPYDNRRELMEDMIAQEAPHDQIFDSANRGPSPTCGLANLLPEVRQIAHLN